MPYGSETYGSVTYGEGQLSPRLFPGVQVQVAFNNNPLDPISTMVWTDISYAVMGGRIQRGRTTHEFGRVMAGTLELDLWNSTAEFNPFNTSSPYYNGGTGLVPMKPVRVVASFLGFSYPLYFGFVEAWPMVWPDEQTAHVKLTCVDGFKVLSLLNLPASVYEAEVRADSPTALWFLSESLPPSGSSTLQVTTAVDSIGNGTKDATYSTAPAPTLGINGAIVGDTRTAITLPTTFNSLGTASNGSVTFPASAGPSGTGDYSVEFWFFGDPQFTFGTNPFAYWNVYNNTGALVINGDGTQTQQTSIIFTMTDGGGVNFQSATYVHDYTYAVGGSPVGSDPLLNKWHHLVGTRSGTTVKLYLDGVQVASASGGANVNIPAQPFLLTRLAGSGGYNTAAAAIYPTALSAARVLAHYKGGTNPWVNDLTGARIGRVLDSVGWAAADRSIEAGNSTLQAAQLGSAAALTYAGQVQDTENGLLFMGTNGQVIFRQRSHLISASASITSQLTLGDGAGEEPYELASTEVRQDDSDIWNEIRVNRQGGAVKIAKDATSRTQYGPRVLTRANTLQVSDNESTDAAQWLLDHYKQPLTRVKAVDVHPLDDATGLFPQVLARDLQDRITVKRSTPGGGDRFSQESIIEAVEHTFDPFDWHTKWSLSPADAQHYWLLGDSTWGVLNSTTRLAY